MVNYLIIKITNLSKKNITTKYFKSKFKLFGKYCGQMIKNGGK